MAKADKGFRTWLLVIIDMVGAFVLCFTIQVPEVVYAYGLVAGGALTIWVSGKGIASYHQMRVGISEATRKTGPSEP